MAVVINPDSVRGRAQREAVMRNLQEQGFATLAKNMLLDPPPYENGYWELNRGGNESFVVWPYNFDYKSFKEAYLEASEYDELD